MEDIINEDIVNGIHYKFVPIEDMLPDMQEASALIRPDKIAVFRKQGAKKLLRYCLMEKNERTEKTETSSQEKKIPTVAIFYSGEKKPKELNTAFEDLRAKFALMGIDLKPKDVYYIQGDNYSTKDAENYLRRSDESIREEVLVASIGTFGCIIVYSDKCLKEINSNKDMDSESKITKLLSTVKIRISKILKKE